MYANQTLHPLHVGPKPVPLPNNGIVDPNEEGVAQIPETNTDIQPQNAVGFLASNAAGVRSPIAFTPNAYTANTLASLSPSLAPGLAMTFFCFFKLTSPRLV